MTKKTHNSSSLERLLIGTFIDPSPLLKNLSHYHEMTNYPKGSGNGVEKQTDQKWEFIKKYMVCVEEYIPFIVKH